MTADWNTTFKSKEWPGWRDMDRVIEMELADGTIVKGKLCAEDYFADGEGDEYPIFIVDDGTRKVSFVDGVKWRFV